ncbi:MAG: uracil-DNA glycosylase [Anaerolineales bacterium]|nr:uracil-DNA glycosylase [Anaerolineales bacterium]
MTAAEALAQIAKEVSACTACSLHSSRKNAVPGEGPADAELLFIGEGPGFHENEQGRPFVGAAGKFLEQLLAGINLRREQVFICNVIKCRPPGNRDPQPDEIEACRPYLDRQIAAIQPRVIVTLGRFSMARYFGASKISSVHGQVRQVDGRLVVAMFHPAAALHQPALRQSIEEDFGKLPALIEQARKQTPAASPPPEATQLTMF